MKNQVRLCDRCGTRADTQGGFKCCQRCNRSLCPKCREHRSTCARCPGVMENVGSYYE